MGLHFRKLRCILSAKSNPVKTKLPRIPIFFTIICMFLLRTGFAQQQGKVVINEYMPWTSNGCGTTSEFVELMNFGPGPVDIGCYILTTGKYSVTIPSNTIIQPGQFYVLGGQDFIPNTCGNIDSGATGIHVNLNWTTCNCTNVPIPTTGDGMMVDGGSANTPLVLLDPSLKIIDAIVRNTPTEPVGPITSSSVGGKCTSKTFNIGTMGVKYEVLGMSAGRANSFARTLDGDCNWLKDPQQSGNATNNRSGRVTDISYDFDMVNATSCGDSVKGSVNIYVKHSDYSVVFPMSYIIALDSNKNGTFDLNDQYTTYYDSTPPFIEIDNLPVGHFKVTVASLNGCYLKTFEFTIIPCYPSTLPVNLVYFKSAGIKNNQLQLEWMLDNMQSLQSIVVEKAAKGGKFMPDKIFANEDYRGSKAYSFSTPLTSNYQYYRLRITSKGDKPFYSPVISTDASTVYSTNSVWPNPVTDKLHLQVNSDAAQRVSYTIYNVNGIAVSSGSLQLNSGENLTTLPITSLPQGVYQLQVSGLPDASQPNSFRFVKH